MERESHNPEQDVEVQKAALLSMYEKHRKEHETFFNEHIAKVKGLDIEAARRYVEASDAATDALIQKIGSPEMVADFIDSAELSFSETSEKLEQFVIDMLVATAPDGDEEEKLILDAIGSHVLGDTTQTLMAKMGLRGLRMTALWTRNEMKKNPKTIAAEGLVKGIATQYVYQNRPVPGKIRLLLPAKALAEIVADFQKAEDRSNSMEVENLRIRHEQERSKVVAEALKQGTHSKIAQKRGEVFDREMMDVYHNAFKGIVRSIESHLKKLDQVIDTYDDIRSLVDELLGDV